MREAAGAREALEDMVHQFAYWSDSAGGYMTGGLSALETAFAVLGWEDPHPYPDGRCDEPGCLKQASMGTPVPMPTRYRRTCWDHHPKFERCVFCRHPTPHPEICGMTMPGVSDCDCRATFEETNGNQDC